MNNYYRFGEPYYEYFELSFNIDDSRLSSKELRSYLLQFEKLVDSINQTLRYRFSEESYDKISIDVLAIEHGSFKIPLLFKKENIERIKNQLKDLTKNPTVAIIIGEIVVHLLTSGLNRPVDVPAVQEPPRIEKNVFLENSDTVKAIKKISKMAIDNDSIRDLTVIYENGNGEKEKIQISKMVLQETFKFMEDVEYEEKREALLNTSSSRETNDVLGYDEKCEVFNDETIEIISMYDSVKPILYFKFKNGVLYAEIRDARFIDRRKAGSVILREGDRIRVDMVALGYGKNKEYYITRVLM